MLHMYIYIYGMTYHDISIYNPWFSVRFWPKKIRPPIPQGRLSEPHSGRPQGPVRRTSSAARQNSHLHSATCQKGEMNVK